MYMSNDSSNDRPLAFGSLPIKSNVLSVASPHAPPTGLDSEVDGAASTSVQGLSDDHSMSAATTSKRTAKIRPDKLPKLTPQRSFEHGRFEEGKPKSQSFRAPAESPRPVTESMLYNLVAAAAFPAAPADKVLDVLANTPVADSRRHQVLGGPQSNSDGVEQTITPDTVPTEETAQNEILPHQAPPSSNSANEQSQVEDGLAFATTCIKRWLPNPFVKLLQDLWPFGQDFKDLGIGGKIYEIVKSPAGFFITLTVPVVDHDKPNDNWNKWLSVLHCVTAPLFFILVTQLGFYNIGGVFPIWTLVLIISTILAMVVAHTSKEDSKPIYHWVFAYVGFLVSVIWIYSVANEIVDILQTFGAAFNVSDGILGLTFLAWGNSIGDAVSNMTMARQGFPQMAVGACIGSPLFNILIAIGIGSIIKMASSGVLEFPIYFSQVELVAAGFLMFSLSCTALVVSCLCFRLTRYYGALLIILYIIFLVTSILAEAGVLHISITGVLTR